MKRNYGIPRKPVDPSVKRFFPWALFLVIASALFLGTCDIRAHSADLNISCEDVVKRVGMKPLWLAERQARKQYPDLTEAQIAWGRQCVEDHRRALLANVKQKIEGAF